MGKVLILKGFEEGMGAVEQPAFLFSRPESAKVLEDGRIFDRPIQRR